MEFTLFTVIFLSGFFIAGFAAFLSWQKRAIRVANDLLLLTLLAAAWTLLLALESAATTVEAKILWAQFEYIPASLAPVVYFLFVLRYAGYDRYLTKPVKLVLSIVPVLNILAAFTDRWHHLLWTGFSDIDPVTNLMEYSHGIWFWTAYAGFHYILMLGATVILFKFISRQPRPFKRMGWLILVGGLIPWIASFLYITDLNPVPGLDLVAFSLSLSGLAFVFAILQNQLFDLIPIARQNLFEKIEEGILMLDNSNRIIDINNSAITYLGLQSHYIVGQPIKGIESSNPGLIDALVVMDQRERTHYRIESTGQMLRLEVQPLKDWTGTRMFVIKDISEQIKTEAAMLDGQVRFENLSRMFRLMSDNLTDMLWAKDLEKKYMFANIAICENLLKARDTEEPIGKTDIFFATRERDRFPERNDWHTFGELCMDSDQQIIDTGKAGKFLEFGNIEGKLVYLDVRKAPIYNESGTMIGVVGSARNVTDQILAEDSIRKRDDLLEAISKSVSILVQGEKLEQSITQALEVIGRATGVNRVYIFENEWAEGYLMPLMSQRFEWTDGSVEPQIGNSYLQRLPYEIVCPRWFRLLSTGSLVVGNVAEFPETERMDLEAQSIKSLLVAPVFIQEKFWGFIGFDDCQQEREWSAVQRQTLAAAASTIGAAYLRKINQEDLKIAKERAEQSDKLKSAFLANMSHEIRTPMNGILGFAELLKEPGIDADARDKYLDIIEKSGTRLLKIINDIVDISKIESGHIEIHRVHFSAAEVMNYIAGFFQPDCTRKGIELICRNNIHPEYDQLFSDKDKLLAILINLVRNAVKFTDQGTITLTSKTEDSMCHFTVADTGIGIPIELQASIFMRFIQATHPDKPHAAGGAGLGLAISRAYAELLGGKIWVESSPNQGSTFHVTFPCQHLAVHSVPHAQ